MIRRDWLMSGDEGSWEGMGQYTSGDSIVGRKLAVVFGGRVWSMEGSGQETRSSFRRTSLDHGRNFV